MNIVESIILGVIQGITEFLPISSTGHLTLAGKLMGLISDSHPEAWTSFIAVIQLGTLASILVYFREDIKNILTMFTKESLFERKSFREQSLHSRLGWLIIIGTIPVVVIGLLFKQQIEGVFTKNLYVIAVSLIALAVLLAVAEKVASHRKEISEVGWLDAVIVGIAQAFALIPGSSRSGTTLTGGLFVGMNREAAARFSFLLSIPAIFASGLLELYRGIQDGHRFDRGGELCRCNGRLGDQRLLRDRFSSEVSEKKHDVSFRLLSDRARRTDPGPARYRQDRAIDLTPIHEEGLPMYEKKPWLKFYGDVPESIDYPRVTMYEALMQTVGAVSGRHRLRFLRHHLHLPAVRRRRSTGAPMRWPPSG